MGAYRDWMKPTSEYTDDWRRAQDSAGPRVGAGRAAPPQDAARQAGRSHAELVLLVRIDELEAELTALRRRSRWGDWAVIVLGLVSIGFGLSRLLGLDV